MNDINYMETIIDTIHYSNRFRHKTALIKIGGSLLDNEQSIKSICRDLKTLHETGMKLIIVHGGSKAINKQLNSNQIQSEFIDGLRATSSEAMDIIEMVLCGHVNSMLVKQLNNAGLNAIGLSGSTNKLLRCVPYSDSLGRAGKIVSTNISLLYQLLNLVGNIHSHVLVISPVGVDAQGNSMNVNADHAASHIATALSVDKLIYLTDEDGIYDDKGEVLHELTKLQLETLIQDSVIHGGMLAKARSILSALNQHLQQVHILNGHTPNVLIEELFTAHGIGTLCVDESSTSTPMGVTQ